MKNMKRISDFLVIILCVGIVKKAYGITGFRNDNAADPRRQISFNQQGQILSDIQQHQHRFNVNQNPGNELLRQSPTQNFIQPNLPINQPSGFSQNQPIFSQNLPQFQPLPPSQLLFQQPIVQNNQPFLPLPVLPQPQEVIQNNNYQFQDNVPLIQQGQTFFHQQTLSNNHHQQNLQPIQQNIITPTQNAPFLPTLPTQSTHQTTKFNFANNQNVQQNVQSNVQQNAIQGQNAFVQNVQTNQNQVLRHGQIPFQSSLGTNPLFSTGQSSQLQSLFEEQRKQDLERLKELQERQKIIQKHKQFLERQQQKGQQKVQKLHDDFTSKQKKIHSEIFATSRPESDYTLNTQSRPREILPHEVDLFHKAIKYYTTTPLPTTTTTAAPTTTTRRPTVKARTRQRAKSRSESENSDVFVQGNNNRQKIYKELKTILQENPAAQKDSSSDSLTPNKLQFLQRTDLLKQLKLAIAENSQDFNGKNFTSREISLPNGQKFEVIRTTDPNLIAGATPLSADSSSLSQIVSSPNQIRQEKPKVSFEELTKDVLPPGADYEVIKQGGNGKLEELGKLPPNLSSQKKVTFVFIEEQGDGSFKVKGVRGNGEQTKESPTEDVDNILKKIKDGEINFPLPAKRNKVSSTSRSPLRQERVKATTYSSKSTPNYSKSSSSSNTENAYDKFEPTKIGTAVTASPMYYNSASPSSLSINHNGSPSTSAASSYYDSTTPVSTNIYSSSQASVSSERNSAFYTPTPSTTVNGHQMYGSTSYSSSSSPIDDLKSEYSQTPVLSSPTSSSYSTDTISIIPSSSTYYPSTNLVARSTTQSPSPDTAGSQLSYSSSNPGLIEILKENGLFATAKYLKQSGLDSILNETGPYTVFAPTDKAFRTLLIQLGGPDKAEEKFKENPRLLSGLLLHHVIPGAFEISNLQDEMTGVSLAGTQLRVNQYAMHDVEWNEIKVTTVNGARVVPDKQDISIPQGIAHAVDRVMFPLPVGDIVQTLQADRERRFTNFLKALFASGLTETLSDTKTFTVFAPTDRAFASLKSEELQQLVGGKEAAQGLVMRHIAPGTLFSAGMRYYQVRDSMEDGKPITLQKNAGRIKVNSGHVVTHNIPTTNGVIHAIDTLL